MKAAGGLFAGVVVLACASCNGSAPTPPKEAPTEMVDTSITAVSSNPPDATAMLSTVPLEIVAGATVHRFDVEVARTVAEQARGLMGRESLGADRGMLFAFAAPQPASFWMKNMVIPLDMIFVRADGSIARIAQSVPPQTLEPVVVTEPVAAVVEIAGGRAAELGIDATAKVRW